MSMKMMTSIGFLITIAETRVITIERRNTMVVMILFLLNILFSYLIGPHRKNDMQYLENCQSLPTKAQEGAEGIRDGESCYIA
jgi:hypothetical protein